MADAAGDGHQAADQAAQQRSAATGQRAVIGQSFGKARGDPGADGGGDAGEEGVVAVLGGERGGEDGGEDGAKTGASVLTEPSMRPTRPGGTICRMKRRGPPSFSLARTSPGLLNVSVDQAAAARLLRCDAVEHPGAVGE